jgi:hypothetical protein
LIIPAVISWLAGDNTQAFLVFLITALLTNKKKLSFTVN